jgi:hypothetical protein
MLEQANSLLLHKLIDHVTEDGANSVETLIGLANVCETDIVKENLLNDEDSDSLAKLGTSLHDTQAQRNDLGGQEEVDNLGGVVLDECSNDAKGGESKVLEWS